MRSSILLTSALVASVIARPQPVGMAAAEANAAMEARQAPTLAWYELKYWSWYHSRFPNVPLPSGVVLSQSAAPVVNAITTSSRRITPTPQPPVSSSRAVAASSPARSPTPQMVVSTTRVVVVASPVRSPTPQLQPSSSRPIVAPTPVRSPTPQLQPSSSRPIVAPSPIRSPTPVQPQVSPTRLATVPSSSVIVGSPLEQPSSARPVVVPSSSRVPVAQPSSPAAIGPAHISGPTQATFTSGSDYQAAVLYHHNAARANHGAGPLVWDSTCEANARLAAQTCTFAHYIPTGVREGQNIFTTSGNYFNVTAAITEFWYKTEFPPMVPYFGMADVPDSVFHSVGHLTQVLWKATTSVGCVSLDCGTSMMVNGATSTLNKFTVCNYASPGNIGGTYGVNVGVPISSTNLGSWLD